MWAAGIGRCIRKCLVEKELCVAKQHQQPVGRLESLQNQVGCSSASTEEMKQDRKGEGVCASGKSWPGPGEIVMQRFQRDTTGERQEATAQGMHVTEDSKQMLAETG